MTEGYFPKINGETYYASEVNSGLRYINKDSGTTLTSVGNLSNIITIPANSAGTGILVLAPITVEITGSNNGDIVGVFSIKCDSSNPPTTIKQSVSLKANKASGYPSIIGYTFVEFITGLTLTSTNYLKITLDSVTASNSNTGNFTCNEIVVIAI